MKFDLQELLEQKALLEKHLAWLDAKIRQLRESETTSAKQEQPVKQEPAPPAKIAELETQLKPPPEPISPKAKYGCVAFAIALIVLVLYTLFVLPYHCQRYKYKQDNVPARK